MSPTLETVWVVNCSIPEHGSMLAFSPAYAIGVAPQGKLGGGVSWFAVTRQGVPLEPIEPPGDGWGPADLLLFRLSQAYTAWMMAGTEGCVLPWKA